MAKLYVTRSRDTGDVYTRYWFHCPGCECSHAFTVRSDGGHPSWTFDGNLEAPTFSPSLLCEGARRCHSFVRAGRIEFLSDCEHPLAGQTVEISDWDGFG